MIDQQELQSLIEFTSETPPILSLYLDVDSTRRTKEEYRLTLRNLLKQAGGKVSDKDVQAVERFFDFEYDGTARGVIIFSCQERGLWRLFTVPVPIEDRLVVARRPYITPLQDILDEYGRYGVVLVDKEGSRLFLFNLGELQEVHGTLGGALKRHKQGGWSAKRLQRKADEIAYQNLKEAAEATKAFCDTHRCERLIVAGTDETVKAFRGMLPKAMQDKIVGEMSMDMGASEVEVRNKTMEIIRAHAREEEANLVQRMITAAAKGEAGVIGLADTLHALQEERVHILLVAEGFEASGARCPHCGYLSAQPIPTCPYCSATMRASDHVVDAAVRLAIEQGVTVKIVAGNEELEKAGHIGAILRY